MSLPSWASMSLTLGVERCRGMDPRGGRCYRNHEGEIEWRGTAAPIIHWRDRRVTKAGIRKYLLLVAETREAEFEREAGQQPPHWVHRYRVLRMLPDLAVQLRLQIPRSLTDGDRAELAAMVVGLPRDPLRDEVLQWCRR